MPGPGGETSPLPSREEIIAFIARERAAVDSAGAVPAKIGKREISRAFGIKGAARIDLKRMLKELEAEGEVERRGKSLHKAGALPPVVLADIKTRDRDGDLIAYVMRHKRPKETLTLKLLRNGEPVSVTYTVPE